MRRARGDNPTTEVHSAWAWKGRNKPCLHTLGRWFQKAQSGPEPCGPCPGSPCPAQKVGDQPSGAKCTAAVSVPSKSSDRVAGEGEWPHACQPHFPHRSMFGHGQDLLACLAASESSLQVCTRLMSTAGVAPPRVPGARAADQRKRGGGQVFMLPS